ncbi:hypothetical protein V4V35_18695 [Bacillus infantis]|uniref:hypothetical protein n=1 Tax=Bacillus infantis TaxID=324767 RepID=UPI002FBD4C75
MSEEKKTAPAATEAAYQNAIKQFEAVIKENNLTSRNATSLFREARWNIFNESYPTRTDL